jgi:hypothetical protein
MTGGTPVAVPFDAQDAVNAGTAGRRSLGGAGHAVHVVPEDVLMIGIDGKNAVPFIVGTVSFLMPVTLDNGVAARGPRIAHFGVSDVLRAPCTCG